MNRREFLVKASLDAIVLANTPLILGSGKKAFGSDLESRIKIAFRLNGDIYTISPGENNKSRLTFTGDCAEPAWSPDGGKIAFIRETVYTESGVSDIYVVSAQGGTPVQITNGPYSEKWPAADTDKFPSWSSDGTKIAYVSHKPLSGILVIPAEGGTPTQIYDTTYLVSVDWSPDGEYFAYCTGGSIYKIPSEGGTSIYLSNGLYPTWSPDGKKIAFTRWKLGGICVMDFDGDNKIIITDEGLSPTWSPDGKKIAYTNNNEIWIKNSDGTNQTYLTDGSMPAWSPYLTETSVEEEKPTLFSLQNYPNPFNSSTLIKYQLPENTRVNLDVYNISGQKIKTLVDKVQNPGLYQVKFDASNLSSGVYFYQLKTEDNIKTNKMMLVK